METQLVCLFLFPFHPGKILCDAPDSQGAVWRECKPLCNANYCDGWAISDTRRFTSPSLSSSIDLSEKFQIKTAKQK